MHYKYPQLPPYSLPIPYLLLEEGRHSLPVLVPDELPEHPVPLGLVEVVPHRHPAVTRHRVCILRWLPFLLTHSVSSV